MIGSWSAPPSSEPTRASRRRRSRSYATRTAARSPPRRGDAVSSSSPAGSKLRARVERTAGSAWRSRASAWSSGRRSSASDVWSRDGGVERVGDLEELGRVEPAAAGRPLDRRPDVVRRHRRRRPAAPRGAPGPGRSRRGRGRRRPGRRTARAPPPAAATAGTRSPRRAARGRAGTRAARSSVRPPVSPGSVGGDPRRTGWPESTNRHGTSVHGAPA